MDSELKRILELENQISELKSALEMERLKAEILNNLIEKANLEKATDIKKINIAPEANSNHNEDKKST
jgi:hypothetical protein